MKPPAIPGIDPEGSQENLKHGTWILRLTAVRTAIRLKEAREERLYEQYPEADLNRKRPISPTNPRGDEYLREGDKLCGRSYLPKGPCSWSLCVIRVMPSVFLLEPVEKGTFLGGICWRVPESDIEAMSFPYPYILRRLWLVDDEGIRELTDFDPKES
jgi:hypothetical protein